jgi:hypothetical protein
MKSKSICVAKFENSNQSMYIELNEKSEIIKYWIAEDDCDDELYEKMKGLRHIIRNHFEEKGYSMGEGLKLLKYTVENLEHYLAE